MIKKSMSLAWLTFSLGCSSQDGTPHVSQGNIKFIPSFPSQLIDPRPIAIWKSPNFEDNKEHITLYLHDGQMLFDGNITWNHQEWNVDEHLAQLSEENPSLSFLVVGIYNNGSKRHAEYFPQKPFEELSRPFQDSLYSHTQRQPQQALFSAKIYSDRYLTFITQELKPYVEENYGASSLMNTWIGGASMGGLISWYALHEYPNEFGAALCFSTHWPGVWPKDDPSQKVFHQFISYQWKHPFSPSQKCYFDHGDLTLDQYYAPYQAKMNAALTQQKVHYQSLIFPGTDHSEKSWSSHFLGAVRWLLSLE